jgi:hypothetical protein
MGRRLDNLKLSVRTLRRLDMTNGVFLAGEVKVRRTVRGESLRLSASTMAAALSHAHG